MEDMYEWGIFLPEIAFSGHFIFDLAERPDQATDD